MACTTGDDPLCRLSWADPNSMWETATATDGNIGEVYAALEVVQALLYPSAKGLKRTSGSATAGIDNAAGNATQSAGASGASGAAASQNTGAAGSVVASMTAVLVVTFAAMLSC
jgi:mannan endo-1,6-alpha-mannosidase